MFYHADAGGNITYLMMTNQTIGASYRYDPFVQVIANGGTYASANTYRFSSKDVQPYNGYYHYGYRFFDPNTQRWVNRDPIGEHDGPNLYTFTRNQPTLAYDLFGLKTHLLMLTFATDRTVDLWQVMGFKGPFQIAGLNQMLEECPCIRPDWENIEVGVGFDTATRGSGGFEDENTPKTYRRTEFDNEMGDVLLSMQQKAPKGFVPVIFTTSLISPDGDATAGGVHLTRARDNLALGIILRGSRPHTLAHELGHHVGYEGDRGGHNAQPSNLMSGGGSGEWPDVQWCRKRDIWAHRDPLCSLLASRRDGGGKG